MHFAGANELKLRQMNMQIWQILQISQHVKCTLSNDIHVHFVLLINECKMYLIVLKKKRIYSHNNNAHPVRNIAYQTAGCSFHANAMKVKRSLLQEYGKCSCYLVHTHHTFAQTTAAFTTRVQSSRTLSETIKVQLLHNWASRNV